MVTGNIGTIVSIGADMASSGAFESDVFDAGGFTYWGRLSEETKGGGSIVFETRSGNVNRPQKNWSEWAPLTGGRVASPSARFLQYKAMLSGPTELDEVDVAYQMKNVAPVVEELEITPANYRFPTQSNASFPSNPPLSLPPMGHNRTSSSSSSSDSTSSQTLTWSKGQIGARWLATDDNDDTLSFKVEIRGVNETGWKLVKDNLRERYYSWDSTAFPDGKYVLRVTASDAPSNPPDRALRGSLEERSVPGG